MELQGRFLTALSRRAFLALALICAATSLNAQQRYHATLTGHGEVPHVLTFAQGEVHATLLNDTLWVSGRFDGLSAPVATTINGGGHIHMAFAGSNGSVIFPLNMTLDPDNMGGTIDSASNGFALTNAQLDALQKRMLYVNIHTTRFTGGEIRGQLLPMSDMYMQAVLTGMQEVPNVMTTGYGMVRVEIAGNQMVVSGSFNNLISNVNTNIMGGAHIHTGMVGRSGSIIFPLNITLNPNMRSGVLYPDSNTFTLDNTQKTVLMERGMYVNIHTLAHGSGEIRGQILGEALTVFHAHLSGMNENPMVVSNGSGAVMSEVTTDSMIIVTGTFQDLTSEVATNIGGGTHIHRAMAGRNGSVIVPLVSDLATDKRSGVFMVSQNTFPATAAILNDGMHRMHYVNVHTLNYTGGEVRGQFLPLSMAVMHAHLGGIQEVPARMTSAHGHVIGEVYNNRMIVHGSFDDLGSDLNVAVSGGAHLHEALAGRNGSVKFPLNVDPEADMRGGFFEVDSNIFQLDSASALSLNRRMLYANIHSTQYPSGEIRGQMLPEARMHFMSILSGSSEMPPVETEAMGVVMAEMKGDMLYVSGSFQGLESDFADHVAGGAHIHKALAGSNGSVRIRLNTIANPDNRSGSFEVLNNTFQLSTNQGDTLMNRMMYVNVHSDDHPGGEIRGQLVPIAPQLYATTLLGINEVGPKMSTGRGGLVVEKRGNRVTVTGSFADLISPYDSTVSGGSHLHMAETGLNGSVAVGLKPTLNTGLLSGSYMANNNTLMLDSTQHAALMNDMLYANIHTSAYPSGELRGQLLAERNHFPDSAALQSPAEGGRIETLAGSTTPTTVMWSATTDPDGHKVVYIWQLSRNAGFDTVLMNIHTGTSAQFVTTLGTLDSLLGVFGIAEGDSDLFYHRVVTLDGSLHTVSESRTIRLARGEEIIGIGKPEAVASTLKVFPIPANEVLNVMLEGRGNEQVSIEIIDVQGRMVHSQQLRLQQGINMVNMHVSAIEPGIYMVKVNNGSAIQTARVVVE